MRSWSARFRSAWARRALLLLALMILLEPSSSHGYLLVSACERTADGACAPIRAAPVTAEDRCCVRTTPTPGMAEAPSDAADSDGCNGCDRVCCAAVCIALSSDVPHHPSPGGHPEAPAPRAGNPSRVPAFLFRPPSA